MSLRDIEEKRDFIRMQVDCTAQCTHVRNGEQFSGQVKDLSGTGLCIELSRQLAPGTLLEVRIEPEMAVVPPMHVVVEVMRVEGEADGACFLTGTLIREFKS